jgi:hypothetical protein
MNPSSLNQSLKQFEAKANSIIIEEASNELKDPEIKFLPFPEWRAVVRDLLEEVLLSFEDPDIVTIRSSISIDDLADSLAEQYYPFG